MIDNLLIINFIIFEFFLDLNGSNFNPKIIKTDAKK